MIASPTEAQLAQLSNFVVQLRAVIATFSQCQYQMNALNQAWNANISAIIGTPNGTTITDATNLAGAVPLTDTQVSQLVTDIQAVMTSYFTTAAQELYAQVCGPMNVLP